MTLSKLQFSDDKFNLVKVAEKKCNDYNEIVKATKK